MAGADRTVRGDVGDMAARDHVVLGHLVRKPPGADHLHNGEEVAEDFDDVLHFRDIFGHAFRVIRCTTLHTFNSCWQKGDKL